jgi:hypothetical protein
LYINPRDLQSTHIPIMAQNTTQPQSSEINNPEHADFFKSPTVQQIGFLKVRTTTYNDQKYIHFLYDNQGKFPDSRISFNTYIIPDLISHLEKLFTEIKETKPKELIPSLTKAGSIGRRLRGASGFWDEKVCEEFPGNLFVRVEKRNGYYNFCFMKVKPSGKSNSISLTFVQTKKLLSFFNRVLSETEKEV